jgi:phage-related protein
LWGIAQSIWSAIVGAVTAAVSRIVAVASGIAGFVSAVIGHFTSAVNAVRNKVGEMADTAAAIPGRILGAIGDLGSLLYNAGRNVIQGLINGISSMIGALKSKISEAAGSIRDALPFSPAKYGPLSGGGSPDIAGAKIATMLAAGITSRLPAIQDAISRLAGAASIGPVSLAGVGASVAAVAPTAAGAPQVRAAPAAAAIGRTYQITVNAIDPRSAATAVIDAIKAFEAGNGTGWRR